MKTKTYDIGEYYESKRIEADRAHDALTHYVSDTPKSQQDHRIIKKLRERLEQARYVGD